MYTKELLPGIDMYLIMLCASGVAAIAVYRVLADKRRLCARLQNLCLFTAVAAIIVGYYSAVLFQALYNISRDGGFVVNAKTGATFYGGLIGGAIFFLIIYFAVGHFMFKKDREHMRSFITVTDIAAASISLAHALGRIGCLFAGCCYGKETDEWYGIYMQAIGKRVIPIQLYEAVFLLILFGIFTYRVLKKKSYGLPLYMALYGVWRFFIEYARADYRGTTLLNIFTPSQLTAVIMVLGAVAVWVFERAYLKRQKNLTISEERRDEEN